MPAVTVMFSQSEIERSFDPATLQRAAEYARSGRILHMQVDRTRRTVTGVVRGSAWTPYSVWLGVRPDRGTTFVESSCSCPVARNCKHGAAIAIALLHASPNSRGRDPADGAVDSWLQRLSAAQRATVAETGKEHVRYVLSLAEVYYVPMLGIAAWVTTALKRGGLGVKRPIDLASLGNASGKYVMPADRIVGRLAAAAGVASATRLSLSPTLVGVLLQLLIETGRLHYGTIDDAVLTYVPIDAARLAWRLDPDERQRATIAGRPAAILLPAKPVWYVDRDRAQAGPVDLGMPQDLAAAAVSAPSLSPAQADRVRAPWQRIVAPFGSEAPVSRSRVEFIDREPTPYLNVRTFVPASGDAGGTTAPFAYAELRFDYGGTIVDATDERREFHLVEAGVVKAWSRRPDAESTAQARLVQLGMRRLAWPFAGHRSGLQESYRFEDGTVPADVRWAHFLLASVPALRADGWRVDVADSVASQLLSPDDDSWNARITPNEHRWFDLDLGITVAGERVSLLPILVTALREQQHTLATGEPVIGRLDDGRLVALDAERVKRALETLIDLFDDEPLDAAGRLPLSAAHIGILEELERLADVRWPDAQPLRAMALALNDPDSTEFVLPKTFHGRLRPYQRHGVAWLQTLAAYGLGGVLADDMGLGKTVQMLAHLSIEKSAGRSRGPALIVAPTSVVPNWRAECERFTPGLRVLSLTGADRRGRFSQIDETDVVLTTYPLLARDESELTRREWSVLVLDEAQAVKNPRSKSAQLVRRLRARQCVALTGTPVENHLEELWTIFSFAMPGLLGDRQRFARTFRTPIEKHGDAMRRNALARRIAPFFLRRTKTIVAADLPAKTEIVQRIELDGAQRDLYETVRLAMHERVRVEIERRGLSRSRILVLDALLKLRQVCCDPRLLKLPAARDVSSSQKLTALLALLPPLLEDGRRVLLFSQFTSMLDLIKPELVRRHINFVELRGDTLDRQTPVERFQNGDIALFLISLKAGGTGLNLTAADTVIHYDPWWNPAVEHQATDRAHRIGQDKPVFVYKLIATGTVEERILSLQERKADLADRLFAEASDRSQPLTPEEIESLFAPA